MEQRKKVSLMGSDVIMSFRGSTPDRENNVYAILQFMDLTYCDYRVFLVEADAAPKFNWSRLSDPKIQHVFICDGGPFPKALLYNTGAKLASSPVIIFNDVDCFVEPLTLAGCVENLHTHTDIDIWCPFYEMLDITGERKQRFMAHPVFDEFATINGQNMPEDVVYMSGMHTGGINVCRRDKFIETGGLNTHMRGWGGEDSEYHQRSSRLGVQWRSLPVTLFHLFHDSHVRDPSHPDARRNTDISWGAGHMPMDELEALRQELRQFFM